jgi:hypothetical protein
LALAKVTHKSHWVGVASHDHVLGAVQGGFCQLGHGKEALVRRLKAGDLIVFYSPRELMGSAGRSFSRVDKRPSGRYCKN